MACLVKSSCRGCCCCGALELVVGWHEGPRCCVVEARRVFEVFNAMSSTSCVACSMDASLAPRVAWHIKSFE